MTHHGGKRTAALATCMLGALLYAAPAFATGKIIIASDDIANTAFDPFPGGFGGGNSAFTPSDTPPPDAIPPVVEDDPAPPVFTGSDPPPSSDPTPSPSVQPSGPTDDEGNGQGKNNNGHGNNADGIDSSNQGNGGGGKTGLKNEGLDPSGQVDDENRGTVEPTPETTGGDAPSQPFFCDLACLNALEGIYE